MVALPSCYRHVQGRTHSPGKTLSSLRGQEAEGKKVHEDRGMKHTLKGTAKVTCFLHLGPLPNDPTNSKQWLGYESVNESSGEHGAPPPPRLNHIPKAQPASTVALWIKPTTHEPWGGISDRNHDISS